jgi:hypothetical protein
MGTVKAWVAENYTGTMGSMQNSLQVAYVVFSFCAAFFLGGIKGMCFRCNLFSLFSPRVWLWLISSSWLGKMAVQQWWSARWRRR